MLHISEGADGDTPDSGDLGDQVHLARQVFAAAVPGESEELQKLSLVWQSELLVMIPADPIQLLRFGAGPHIPHAHVRRLGTGPGKFVGVAVAPGIVIGPVVCRSCGSAIMSM